MHKPLRELKPAIISLCKEHHEKIEEGQEEIFAIPYHAGDQRIHTVKGIINIVRNAMSPTFFGANIIFENYECELSSGSGTVEFSLVLPEVSETCGIVDQLVRVSIVNHFTGSDIDAFIDEFIRYTVMEWNEE